MRALVAVVLGGLSVVLIIAGVRGSGEQLISSLLGIKPKDGEGVHIGGTPLDTGLHAPTDGPAAGGGRRLAHTS